MSEAKSKFPTMSNSAAKTARNASGEDTGKGKLVAKKHGKSADPAKQAAGKKTNVKKSGDRTYGITSSMAGYKDPAIAPVQSNGRIFSPAINRVAPNFKAGSVELD